MSTWRSRGSNSGHKAWQHTRLTLSHLLFHFVAAHAFGRRTLYKRGAKFAARKALTAATKLKNVSGKKILANGSGRAPLSSLELSTGNPARGGLPFLRRPGEATARRGTKIMPFGNSDSLAVGLFLQGKNVSEKVKFPLLPPLPLGVHASPPALRHSTGKQDSAQWAQGVLDLLKASTTVWLYV